MLRIQYYTQQRSSVMKNRGEMSFSYSQLFTSRYHDELANDPSFLKMDGVSINSEASSQLVEFKGNSLKVDQDRVFDVSQPSCAESRTLKRLLDSVLGMDSDFSCINKSDDEQTNLKMDMKLHSNTSAAAKVWQDENKDSCCDIKEHPSFDSKKGKINPTKERYKKYMTHRKPASRGVFEYPTTPNSKAWNEYDDRKMFKDIKDNAESPWKINAAAYIYPINEPSDPKVVNDQSNWTRQRVRHMRTKTMDLGRMSLTSKHQNSEKKVTSSKNSKLKAKSISDRRKSQKVGEEQNLHTKSTNFWTVDERVHTTTNQQKTYDLSTIDRRLIELHKSDINFDAATTPDSASGYDKISKNILRNAKMQVSKTFQKYVVNKKRNLSKKSSRYSDSLNALERIAESIFHTINQSEYPWRWAHTSYL